MRTAIITTPCSEYKFQARQARLMQATNEGNIAKLKSTLDLMIRDARKDMKVEIAEVRLQNLSLAGGDISDEVSQAYVRGQRVPRSDVESFSLAIPELLMLERYERR